MIIVPMTGMDIPVGATVMAITATAMFTMMIAVTMLTATMIVIP